MIEIYTDGSFKKPYGGWAYLILDSDSAMRIESASKIRNSKENPIGSNSMELQAIKEAILCCYHLQLKEPIILYSDSVFAIQALTTNVVPAKDGNLICNIRNILKIIELNIEFRWIKGHSRNIHNKYVDVLAGECSHGGDDYFKVYVRDQEIFI